jgi:hypothetical protein
VFINKEKTPGTVGAGSLEFAVGFKYIGNTGVSHIAYYGQ